MTQEMRLVGATGMLWPAVIAWHEAGHAITLLARSRARVAAKIDALPGLEPAFIEVDYHDEEAWRAALDGRETPAQCVVAWVHGSAPRALDVMIDAWRPTRLIHVLGSAAAHPLQGTAQPLRERHAHRVAQYQQVVLGFARRADGSTRWLTHDEISRGVLDAHASGDELTIVGSVEPWSDRP